MGYRWPTWTAAVFRKFPLIHTHTHIQRTHLHISLDRQLGRHRAGAEYGSGISLFGPNATGQAKRILSQETEKCSKEGCGEGSSGRSAVSR